MSFLYILLALLMFGVLIFIHELGHFIAARLCGVEILEFAIGMGPKLISWKSKKNGTRYSLRLFPIGGYVSMLGENGMEAVQGSADGEFDEKATEIADNKAIEGEAVEGEVVDLVQDPERAKRAYCNQNVWKRILISIAGPLMNVLLGFLLMLIITVAAGEGNLGTTTVADFHIVYQSEESLSGLLRGDYVDAVNGVEVNSFAQMKELVAADEDGLLQISVRRLNAERTEVTRETLTDVPLDFTSLETLFTSSVSEQSGLQVNDEIVKVNRVRVHTHYELSYEITMQGYRALDLTVIRNGEEVVLENVLFPNTVDEASKVTAGEIDFRVFAESKYHVGTVLRHAWYRSVSMVKMVYDTLAGLFSGRYGMEAVSGPVGITKEISKVAQQSLLNILPMMALISINLGVMNLLPLPALDGGHLLLYAIEVVRRKPVKPEVESVINFIGLVLLLGLAVIIAIKDIIML